MKILFTILLLFVSTISYAGEIKDKPLDLIPPKTVDELLDQNDKPLPKIELPKITYLVKLTNTAKESFLLEVQATSPIEVVVMLMSNDSNVIIVPQELDGKQLLTFIMKSHITSIQVLEKPKVVEKPDSST